MRNISKFYPIIAALILGVIGGIIRGMELLKAIDTYTGIYDFGGLGFLLPLLTVIAVCFAVISSRKLKKDNDRAYVDIMKVNSKPVAIIGVIGALIIAAAGVISFISTVTDAYFWSLVKNMAEGTVSVKAVLKSGEITDVITSALYAVLMVFAGVSIIATTMKRVNGKLCDHAEILLSIPMYWACFLFLFTFVEHPVEPVRQIFVYDLLASCALLIAVYKYSAIAYGRKCVFSASASSLCAMYLMTTVALGRLIHIVSTGSTYYLYDAPLRMVCFGGALLVLLMDTITVLQNSGKREENNDQTDSTEC